MSLSKIEKMRAARDRINELANKIESLAIQAYKKHEVYEQLKPAIDRHIKKAA